MTRLISRIALSAALVGGGWAIGRAQSTAPDFEISIEAPVGKTDIQCVRGCSLKWVQRGDNADSGYMPTFWFECGAGTLTNPRCSSGKIGGRVTR